MIRQLAACCVSALALAAVGCSGADNLVKAGSNDSQEKTGTPARLTADEKPAAADDIYYVKFDTTKGDVVIEVHSEWSPKGAAHFKELVENKFYDGCRFFRVLDGFMAQVGMNGDPKVQEEWGERTIDDEAPKRSNKRGFVTYAKGGPNSRSTQIFFNYGDNSRLDNQGFPPFAVVIEGMSVLDNLYSEYGEGAPNGNGPSQGLVHRLGNAYLDKEFPKLDSIKTARIIEKSEVKSLEKKSDKPQ